MSRSTLLSRRQFARHLFVVGGAGAALACAAPSQAREDSGTAANAAQPAPPAVLAINHVMPRRDFVGPQPQRFEWTAAAGVDRYAVGIWNDADRLMWRDDHVTGTSVSPTDLHLDAGTYYWMVSGVRDERQIADSGLAAFVVEG